MNTRKDWAGAEPRFMAACALAMLFASSAGCADSLDPAERPDNLELNDQAVADAGAGPIGKPVPGQATTGIGWAGGSGVPNATTGIGWASGSGVPNTQAGTVAVGWAGGDPNGKPSTGATCTSPGDANGGGDVGKFDPGVGVPVARSCTGLLIGDGKTCVSYSDVKLKGPALCAAQGLELTDLKVGNEDCPGGSSQSWISCCTKEAPPPVSACSGGVIGDGTSCIDWSALKLKASEACQAQKASLTQLYPATDPSCPDGARAAKFECCTTFAAPPTPVSPGKEVL